MRLILDATPLIHLTKAEFPLEKLGVELITTNDVLKEVLAEEFPENVRIKSMLNSKKLSVKNPKSILEGIGTHEGELSVISLAKETNSICIIDDRIGRAFAKSLKVKTIYSTALVVEASKKKIITKQEARNFIDKMIVNGWRCDVATYSVILAKIEGIE